MKFSYLTGNGVNATFIAGTVTSKLSTTNVTQNRKVSGVTIEHRRTEIKVSRSANIEREGSVKGTEPLSVSIVLSGSTEGIAQGQLDLMLQDAFAVASSNWNTLRVVGVAPRDLDGITVATMPLISNPSTGH